MKIFILFVLVLLTGCNSEEAVLSSIQGISAPANNPQIFYVASLNPDGNYTTGTLDFEVRFTQEVEVEGVPRLGIETRSGTVFANYYSGSGTDSWIFKLNITPAISDYDGIQIRSPLFLNGGSIFNPDTQEDALLSFHVPDTSGVLINFISDPVPPSVASVEFYGTKKAFKRSEANPILKVTFNENVTVSLGSTSPYIEVNIGGTIHQAGFFGFDGTSTNIMRFLLVTSSSTPIDLDGAVINPELHLADSAIRDPAGNLVNTDFSALMMPKLYIIPETLRDWFDANDFTSSGSFIEAFSKTSVLKKTVYGNVTINNSIPKTFQFDIGASLVADSDVPMHKALIVYRVNNNPDGKALLVPYNYNSNNGCYTDYRGQEICVSLSGAALIPDIIADPSLDYGVVFNNGQFQLGTDCTAGVYACSWFNSSLTGERMDDLMDGSGVLLNPFYSYDGQFKYSIVDFNGTTFRPVLGDRGFDEEIAEVMYFSSGFSTATTSDDLAAIESYLTAKYGYITLQ